MPEGSYTSGGMDVIMKDNLCWLADGKSIAGSVLTLAQGVKNIVDWGIASADIAIRMATEVPARSRTSRVSAAASCRVATPTLSCSTMSLPSSRRMLAARASATPLPSNDRKRRRAESARTRRMG
ncbi:MAG: hypothetical protein ACLU0O_04005 [Collinsella sp.]